MIRVGKSIRHKWVNGYLLGTIDTHEMLIFIFSIDAIILVDKPETDKISQLCLVPVESTEIQHWLRPCFYFFLVSRIVMNRIECKLCS